MFISASIRKKYVTELAWMMDTGPYEAIHWYPAHPLKSIITVGQINSNRFFLLLAVIVIILLVQQMRQRSPKILLANFPYHLSCFGGFLLLHQKKMCINFGWNHQSLLI